jgi:hypothetical protein
VGKFDNRFINNTGSKVLFRCIGSVVDSKVLFWCIDSNADSKVAFWCIGSNVDSKAALWCIGSNVDSKAALWCIGSNVDSKAVFLNQGTARRRIILHKPQAVAGSEFLPSSGGHKLIRALTKALQAPI